MVLEGGDISHARCLIRRTEPLNHLGTGGFSFADPIDRRLVQFAAHGDAAEDECEKKDNKGEALCVCHGAEGYFAETNGCNPE